MAIMFCLRKFAIFSMHCYTLQGVFTFFPFLTSKEIGYIKKCKTKGSHNPSAFLGHLCAHYKGSLKNWLTIKQKIPASNLFIIFVESHP